MGLLRGFLDRVVLVAAILAAGCVPSFIAQYRQRLGGMLDQAVKDIALFQEIANRYHGGDLQRLIKHHLASTDPTFNAEGKAIQTMVENAASLRAALEALNADLWGQMAYLVRHGDAAVARSTWDAFVPALSLTGESLLFAGAIGVAVWIVFLGCWVGCERVARGRTTAPGWAKAKRAR